MNKKPQFITCPFCKRSSEKTNRIYWRCSPTFNQGQCGFCKKGWQEVIVKTEIKEVSYVK